MSKFTKRLSACAVAVALLPASAFATNGMNMEGYGPVALGMGGASMAYDNGTAATMNNPATLGLADDGTSRLDLALGALGINITSTVPTTSGGSGVGFDSAADAFYMPAIGYAKRSGKLTYGVGMFAQGGMGTEYSANSDFALASGDKVMSQVSVGRLMAPVTYNVDDKLTVGGSVDFVWANMDLKMAVPTAALGGMVTGASPTWGAALPGLATMDWGRFDFSDSSDFTGAAKGQGFAAKLGMVYKVNSKMSIGATYHSETSLSDMEAGATMSAGNFGGGALASFNGTIKVRDFQWPSTYGVGMAYQANDKLMVAADIKQINWSDVMESFKMTFSNAMGDLDVAMPQNWEDQTVTSLGVSYKQDDKLTWRFGANLSDNPVPNSTVNFLFPATLENHYTVGVGYDMAKQQSINFAMSYAPEVEVTGTGPVGTGNGGHNIKHSQTNWQVMYSQSF